jgi:hypothetical protein
MTNKKLLQFLLKAKNKTFASKISIPKLTKDRGKEYIYRKGDLLYKDKYFGSTIDTGQELVFYKKNLIWSMSYRGGMIKGYENLSKKCFSFLKECLRNSPEEFPVRGPKKYEKGNFQYENSWKGNIEDFIGEEKILLNKKQIYFRNYLGGTGKAVK